MYRALSSRLLVPAQSKLKQIALNTLLFPTSIPFTSPDNEWCAPIFKETTTNANKNLLWGNNLSFTHPESDWISTHTETLLVSKHEHSHSVCEHLSFATIESDFCAPYGSTELHLKLPRTSLSHISLATPVSDFIGDNYLDTIPRSYTITEALAPSTEARVLTDANTDFRVQHVNEAWTRLCGYTNNETLGQTLGMIQGNDTDSKSVDDLVSLLQEGKSVNAMLINYTKEGRRFHNHLTINPVLCSETQNITHFIGVMKEIDGENKEQFARTGN